MRNELKRIIGELAGTAGMCWFPTPDGIYDSERATELVDQALTSIINLVDKVIGEDEPIKPINGVIELERNKLRTQQRAIIRQSDTNLVSEGEIQ